MSDKFNDIDVALLLSEEQAFNPYKSLKFSLKVATELERKLTPRFKFDVKVLNNVLPEFQFEVIRKGKVIFSRDESLRIDFEADVISTYLDLKPCLIFWIKSFWRGLEMRTLAHLRELDESLKDWQRSQDFTLE